jgi:TonB family protein
MAALLILLAASAARITAMQLDYPPKSLVANEQGVVAFKVEVLANGKARNCEIVSGSGFPALDKATCDQVVTRATFAPATNASGKSVNSTLMGSMSWKIPPRAAPTPEPAPKI